MPCSKKAVDTEQLLGESDRPWDPDSLILKQFLSITFHCQLEVGS